MALDALVDSSQLNSELTGIANAIRTKGGTSAQLAFPAGFVSAVEAIPTGITTETDPTVPAWAKQPTKPTYTAAEVGAVAADQGTANAGKVLTVGADGNVTTKTVSAWTEQTISKAGAVTQALDPNVMYHFTGALTALTVTLNAATSGQLAQYHFDFNCGSTAPTVTIPATVTLPDGNSFDANKHYEVDILNSYGVVAAWADS